MGMTLYLHPGSRCAAVTSIEVRTYRPARRNLALHFAVNGQIAALRVPAVTARERADGLWRHTCFEAFLATAPGRAYYEFNVSPSTQWAAYRFEDYRQGMSAIGELGAPQVDITASDRRFELQTILELPPLPDLPDDGTWRLGLAAVIEEIDGNISHWALAHPPGRPDFHHSDCFALELPAA